MRYAWRVALFTALVVVALLLPRVVSSFRLVQFATVGIYFIAIFGLNILTGYSGQVSLGHGAFMAIGGYTSAILIVHHGWSDLATIPVAGLVAGVAGLLFGIPALRLSGLYLALATFALAVSMPSIIKKWSGQTGGSSGLLVNVFHTNRWYYAVTWISAGILFVLGWLLLRTKFSRAWRAIRDSEVAAASMGINLAVYKTAAFGVSALYAGVAGALLVIVSFGANPGSFPLQLSIYLVVGLAVAGLGSLVGVLAGAAFIEYVQVYAPDISRSPGVPTVAFGVALVLVMFLLPGGVAGLLRHYTRLKDLWNTGAVKFVGVFLCALALVAAAGATRLDPGVSSTSVKIGGTVPVTGVAAAYQSVGRGALAYFKYVNDTRGGVNGRKIDYEYLDDAYDPSKTVEQTRKLVEQDGVFAVFNSLGTEHSLATRGYLNQMKVPQLFVATGATTFGRDYKQYPWSIGFLPSYVAEGLIYGKYIGANVRTPKVAVLYQDDDYGKELVSGLKKGLGPLAKKVVGSRSYSADASDVNSQVASLKASKANVFMIFATPKFAIQAFIQVNKLGWKPKLFVNQVSSASNIMKIVSSSIGKRAEGAISIADFKDPTNSAFKKDATVKLYRKIMSKYASGADVSDVYHVYAMAVAWTFVEALKKAGNPPTRAGIMSAVTHLNLTNPFMLPGIRVTTTPTDHFPVKQAQLETWKNGSWHLLGKPVSARS
jgi:ABC-type branched-subunit amino acid transport system permease subunit/ABC-type branched-subunit amino acid transport system substrate-binding protein